MLMKDFGKCFCCWRICPHRNNYFIDAFTRKVDIATYFSRGDDAILAVIGISLVAMGISVYYHKYKDR
ncbi:hypothetical protein SaSA201_0295 [Streptococcus agalactiae]|nr:hypothetical protein SaSA30_0296 [Streptococcus agalactiae]EPU06347.1 hypothetical protein SAG0123_07910 [Streptococcus agalactiae STIR-CD-13]AUO81515.1 hypothetical protein SaSA33_0296 [Streptococcus agalactiae]AUO83119.1 hypothetical protein SaSA53_0295 [Streptococcus agalactiae]AUO84800.1 hypothetical protein SaSA73_0296 [Streptococcus agalactiae]